MKELFGLWGKEKRRLWSEISKLYAASTTTAYQLGAKIRFSPNKCGSQSTLTLVFKLLNYGRLNDGRYALEAVLETAQNYVGQDRKKDCEVLLRELRTKSKGKMPSNVVNGENQIINAQVFPHQIKHTAKTIEHTTVFISYSHIDTEFVTRLRTDLEKRGVRVWIDVKDIEVGESISESVENALSNTEYVCLILSKNSYQSAWVQREYRTALNLQLEGQDRRPKILPIIIDEINLPPLLRDIRYADFRFNYQAAFAQLCSSIKVPIEIAPFLDILNILKSNICTYQKQFLESFASQDQLVLSPIWRAITSGAKQLKEELKEYTLENFVVVKVDTVKSFLKAEDVHVGLLELPNITMCENIQHGLRTDYSFDYSLKMDGVYELIDNLVSYQNAVISRKIYLVPKRTSWSLAVLDSNEPTSTESVQFLNILDLVSYW